MRPIFLTGLILTMIGLPLPATAAVIHPHAGESLQEAVTRAAEGDTLVVPPGPHAVDTLRLTKPMTLRGNGEAVLDGGGSGNVVRVTSPGVRLRGLTIRNSGMDLNAMDAGIYVEEAANGFHLAYSYLDHNAWGVWVNGANAVVIRENRIHGNTDVVSPKRGNGVQLWKVSGALLADNEIWETRDGVYIEVSHGANIIHSNYFHDLRYGVHYMYSHRNEVTYNRTRDNRAGYALMFSDKLEVHHNRSVQDEDYGILMNYVRESEIHHNRVLASPEKCIFIFNSQHNQFHHNWLEGCQFGIHLTAGSNHNRLFTNAFLHSRDQVKYVGNREQEWSQNDRGNYWSDYMGWDRDGDGIGDVPYRPNDMVDKLAWKYPLVRVLMKSPAVQTLRWVQRQFPVLRDPGVTDSHPLMSPPEGVAP